MLIAVSLVVMMLLSSSTLPYVFAAKPSSGFKSSANCSFSLPNIKTCCWRESNGVTPGESYCQSCTMGGADLGTISTCIEPELQFRSGQHWGLGIISPGGDKGVLAKAEDRNQEEDVNQVTAEGENNTEDQPQQEQSDQK